jgi:RNA polymerase sigma factor (sigma-70 family)
MSLELTDSEALRRSLDEPTAFGLVYERHLDRVYLYLRRRLGDAAAEDVTAEVFVRAFRGRAKFRADYETALPWLLGIAGNLIGDHRRAERRRLTTLAKLTAPGEGPRPETTGTALSHELVEALRSLPAADRDTLLLVVWGELSYEEAAVALDVPIGTVRSRIARARARLTADGGLAGRAGRAELLMNGEANA